VLLHDVVYVMNTPGGVTGKLTLAGCQRSTQRHLWSVVCRGLDLWRVLRVSPVLFFLTRSFIYHIYCLLSIDLMCSYIVYRVIRPGFDLCLFFRVVKTVQLLGPVNCA